MSRGVIFGDPRHHHGPSVHTADDRGACCRWTDCGIVVQIGAHSSATGARGVRLPKGIKRFGRVRPPRPQRMPSRLPAALPSAATPFAVGEHASATGSCSTRDAGTAQVDESHDATGTAFLLHGHDLPHIALAERHDGAQRSRLRPGSLLHRQLPVQSAVTVVVGRQRRVFTRGPVPSRLCQRHAHDARRLLRQRREDAERVEQTA